MLNRKKGLLIRFFRVIILRSKCLSNYLLILLIDQKYSKVTVRNGDSPANERCFLYLLTIRTPLRPSLPHFFRIWFWRQFNKSELFKKLVVLTLISQTKNDWLTSFQQVNTRRFYLIGNEEFNFS